MGYWAWHSQELSSLEHTKSLKDYVGVIQLRRVLIKVSIGLGRSGGGGRRLVQLQWHSILLICNHKIKSGMRKFKLKINKFSLWSTIHHSDNQDVDFAYATHRSQSVDWVCFSSQVSVEVSTLSISTRSKPSEWKRALRESGLWRNRETLRPGPLDDHLSRESSCRYPGMAIPTFPPKNIPPSRRIERTTRKKFRIASWSKRWRMEPA